MKCVSLSLKISLSCELAKASGVETVSTFTKNGIGFNEITLYWMITNINVAQILYILFICGCQYHPPFRQTRKLPYSFKWFILWGHTFKKMTHIWNINMNVQVPIYKIYPPCCHYYYLELCNKILWKYMWYESTCFSCASLWNISLPRIQNVTPVMWWYSTEFLRVLHLFFSYTSYKPLFTSPSSVKKKWVWLYFWFFSCNSLVYQAQFCSGIILWRKKNTEELFLLVINEHISW